MRYQVGQKIWTMWADNVGAFMYPFYSRLENFDQYEPSNFPAVQFRLLEVTEHHRVKGEWDADDKEPENDGYILKEADGTVWHNQYPIAHYGQLTCTQDQRFDINEKCEKGAALLEWLRADTKENRGHAPMPASMACLCSELQEIRRAIYTMETGNGTGFQSGQQRPTDPERAAKLRSWFEYILSEFGKQTGLSLIEEPHPLRELPGWFVFKVEEANDDEQNEKSPV